MARCTAEARLRTHSARAGAAPKARQRRCSALTTHPAAARAKAHGIPYLAIAGGISEGIGAFHVSGIDAVFSLCRGPMTLDEAQRNAGALLADAAEQAVRGFVAGR